MRSLLRTSLTLSAVCVALNACSSDTASGPAVPRIPNGANPALSVSCDFNSLKTKVRAYVASSTDPIYTTIRNLQKATQDGVAADVYTYGLDGLARLALVRSDPTLKKTGATAAAGAAAAIGFIACVDFGPLPDNVESGVLAAFGSGGLFEVPGSTGPSTPVFGRGESPFWGAQPGEVSPGVDALWSAITSKRFLLYGYKIAYGPGQGNDDPTAISNPNKNGFDYNTLPTIGTATGQIAGFNPALIIGVCSAGTATTRIKHVDEILTEKVIDCPPSAPVLASLPRQFDLGPLALYRGAVEFFVPKPLHAATMFGVGSIGGAVSELSPTSAIQVAVKLAFTSQPTDGFINTTIPGTPPSQFVEVTVTTLAGTPLNKARVEITVAGNNGNPVTAAGTVEETNSDGVAIFDLLSVSKAGGYTLRATANFDNLSGSPVISQLFNIQNKTAP